MLVYFCHPALSSYVRFVYSIQIFSLSDRSCYTASKHALQGFFDSLRAEVAENKVKVTVISPGYIATNLSVNAVTGDGSLYGGEF